MLSDPAAVKSLVVAVFNAGMIWGGIKAAQRQQRNRQKRQGQAITRLLQYQRWSHRALSIIISHHETNHPGQHIIEDWKEIEEGDGSNGD